VSANAQLFLTLESPSIERELTWWERGYSDWEFAVAWFKFSNNSQPAALSVLARIPPRWIRGKLVLEKC